MQVPRISENKYLNHLAFPCTPEVLTVAKLMHKADLKKNIATTMTTSNDARSMVINPISNKYNGHAPIENPSIGVT
jgi:hypothetical protein